MPTATTPPAPPAAEPFRSLRRRFRTAILLGRLDFHSSRTASVRPAIERHFSHQKPRQIERRYAEYERRRPLLSRWLLQGIPHAERVVRIDGLRHLEAALSDGAGAILASTHFGHGRLIKPVLGVHGCPALLVGMPGRRMPAKGPGRVRRDGRALPWPPIAAEDLPVTLNLRPHFAALQENRPLIIMVDGRSAASVTRIPVHGIGVHFASGTMRIARAAGAPVLPTFVTDEGTLRDPLGIRLVIHPPLALQSSDDADADLVENLTRFAAVYAKELERNPHNISWRYVGVKSGEYGPAPEQGRYEPGQDKLGFPVT